MIRSHDETLSLSQRTARAQACGNVHGLITIHTNSASTPEVQGVETFCHQPHLFKTTVYVGDHGWKPVVKDFYKDLDARSYEFAQIVHKNILKYAQKENKNIVDRKVQYKVSQLLLGSTVPSILLELGFLTHPLEKELLQKESYQQLLAQGIVAGVEETFPNSFI